MHFASKRNYRAMSAATTIASAPTTGPPEPASGELVVSAAVLDGASEPVGELVMVPFVVVLLPAVVVDTTVVTVTAALLDVEGATVVVRLTVAEAEPEAEPEAVAEREEQAASAADWAWMSSPGLQASVRQLTTMPSSSSCVSAAHWHAVSSSSQPTWGMASLRQGSWDGFSSWGEMWIG